MISTSSFASNLLDNSFPVSKKSPGALYNELGALAFSASLRERPSDADILPDSARKRRGPTESQQKIAGFKEPTENGHAGIPSNNFDAPVPACACTDSPEFLPCGRLKATATVLLPSLRRPSGVCTNLWTCKGPYRVHMLGHKQVRS